MVRRFYDHADTITKAEYDALDLDRPYTDAPIGGTTDGKRSAGALCSSLFDHPSIIPTPTGAPVTIRQDLDAQDHTLTRREVMAARDADVPGSGDLSAPEPRKPPASTQTATQTSARPTA